MAQDPLASTGSHFYLNGLSDSSGSQRLDNDSFNRQAIVAIGALIESRDRHVNERLQTIEDRVNKQDARIADMNQTLIRMNTKLEILCEQLTKLQSDFQDSEKLRQAHERENHRSMQNHLITGFATVIIAIIVAFILTGLKLKS
jgi:uncharacterized coiled-coil protein SlyX